MTASSPLLHVEGLHVTYGGVSAVNDVTFAVERGQIFGLIGPNGAGKTSLIDAVTGYTTITRGRVMFKGRNITRDKPHRRARAGLGRTFQSTELFDDLTVVENLAVANGRITLWMTLHDLVVPLRRPGDHKAVTNALALCGLEDVADQYPAALSHGQRRLVGVARALAAEPALVLLDEPAAGLDTDESVHLADQIRVLRELGISVLLVDHDMSLVLSICDEVMVLDFGRSIARGSPQQIRDDPSVIEAYLGTP